MIRRSDRTIGRPGGSTDHCGHSGALADRLLLPRLKLPRHLARPDPAGVTSNTGLDVLAELCKPEIRSNPHPLLSQLREHDPVHRTRAGFYLLTRHADVLWALQHSGTELRTPESGGGSPYASKQAFLSSFAMKNPPEHTRLRRMVARDFTPQRVDHLRPTIASICQSRLPRLVDPLRDGETVDAHTVLSMPLATEIAAALIGIPATDSAWLAEFTAASLSAVVPLAKDQAGADAVRERADQGTAPLMDYFTDLFAQRRRTPADDLVSAMLAHPDGDRFTDAELLGTLWTLWVGAIQNLSAAIDHGIRVILNEPHQLDWLHGDLPQATAFCAEVARCEASSMHSGIPQIACQDLEFSGITVPAGSDVRPSIAAANRDPAVFADPDRFDPSRDHHNALTFGHGIHRSPGQFLTLACMTECLPLISTALPARTVAGEPVWNEAVSTRHLRALPLWCAIR